MSHQLNEDLATAFAAYLSEQTCSTNRFLGVLANFCDSDGWTGPVLAQTLRELQSKRAVPPPGTPTSQPLTTPVSQRGGVPEPPITSNLPVRKAGLSQQELDQLCSDGEEIEPTSLREQQGSAVNSLDDTAPAFGSPTSSCRNRRLPKGSPFGSDKATPPPVRLCMGSPISPQSTDKATIKQEFALSTCKFISSRGEVVKPPNEFERAFGPKIARFIQRMLPEAKKPRRENLSQFGRFVDGNAFQIITTLVICLNFFIICYQTDYKIKHLHSSEPPGFTVANSFFTLYYVFEVSAMIHVHRAYFFLGDDMLWNWFDLVIALEGVGTMVMTFGFGIESGNRYYLRILRLLFCVSLRVLRMFHALRIFKEIRLMVDSLAGSLSFFFWCGGFLWLFLSLFAICFVQAVTSTLEGTELSDDARTAMMKDFGSVSQCMLSLLLALTGSSSWGDQYRTLKTTGVIWGYLYLFFVLFYMIAFLNVISAVFLEKAMSLADHHTTEEKMHMKYRKRYNDAKELLSMLSTVLKDDGTRKLDSDAFEEFLSDPRVAAYFEMKGLNESSARRFFRQLLEVHQANEIDFGTFASSCVKLDGKVSSLDSYMLCAQIKAMRLAQSRLQQSLGDLLNTGSGAPPKDLFKAGFAGSPEAPRVFSVPTPCRRPAPAPASKPPWIPSNSPEAAFSQMKAHAEDEHASNFRQVDDGLYHIEDSDAFGLVLERQDTWSEIDADVSPQAATRMFPLGDSKPKGFGYGLSTSV